MTRRPFHRIRPEDQMRAIGNVIDKIINPDGRLRLGYCLLVFEFGNADSDTNYISTARREDMIAQLRKMITTLENTPAPGEKIH